MNQIEICFRNADIATQVHAAMIAETQDEVFPWDLEVELVEGHMVRVSGQITPHLMHNIAAVIEVVQNGQHYSQQ